MITDKIDLLMRYAVPQSEAILKFMAKHDCSQLPDGEMEIEGRELFVRIMSYTPKPSSENRFETHQVYADLQYVVSGAEIMQTARLGDLTPSTDYDKVGDYRFYQQTGFVNSIVVGQGEFAVFYPQEAHRPSCLFEAYHGIVKKMVFKIKIN